ncbi:DUF4168 domain-containing protein [Pseudanabaena sp. FACHB-2040]|uniref:DUF4168 domain-containing protein n=1 Tax=Pseudanabaena sp. FACHB-2040 TaxID=2692859 RepID=UPI001686EA83|nr:DUF4168 domain-containing protein [Pseudanabaena sp. FACHB-2040]MBD2257868.1 DUF4168 domain-containing protein [Pseudanabaena sp. FACHB-2040]
MVIFSMVIFKRHCPHLSHRLKGRFGQLILAGMVALLANGSGVVIRSAGSVPTVAISQASAQGIELSAEEVTGYANSILQMDGPRNDALNQIRSLLSGVNFDISQVDMTCPNTRNLNQLPRPVRSEVRGIVVNYCNQARTIVESNGLTVRRFNLITEAHQSDPGLAERIRTVLVQLQQQQSRR